MEFKFRGKVIGKEQWVYGNLLEGVFKDTMIQSKDESGFLSTVIVDKETVGIHIGWSDFNDTNVFTGDAIEIYWRGGKDDTTVEVITYDAFYGYFKYGNNPMCELKDPVRCFFVCGNIYDNPELTPSEGGRLNTMITDPNAPKEGQEEVKAQPAEQATEGEATQEGEGAEVKE